MTLTLRMLPARHGDALWLEYGDPGDRHCVLVDGGPSSTATRRAVTALVADRPDLELLVVSHIDADHITGVLSLLEDRDVPLRPRDVWFNGWEHLPSDVLGAKQGERLSAAIVRRRLPWNADFGGEAVLVPDDGPLPVVELPGGLRLTLLSPTRRELAALRPVWKAEVEKAGLVPGHAAEAARAEAADLLGGGPVDVEALAAEPFEEDDSEANGASIAALAEHGGASLLLTGDAHASVLVAGLRRLASERGVPVLPVDAVKLPHHGSRHNVSPELVAAVRCPRYLFSTSGSIFGHPDPVAVARVVGGADDVTLEFNYRSASTEPWESPRLQRRLGYRVVLPPDGEEGLVVEL